MKKRFLKSQVYAWVTGRSVPPPFRIWAVFWALWSHFKGYNGRIFPHLETFSISLEWTSKEGPLAVQMFTLDVSWRCVTSEPWSTVPSPTFGIGWGLGCHSRKTDSRWAGSWSRWDEEGDNRACFQQMFLCRITKEQREQVVRKAAEMTWRRACFLSSI